MIIIINRNLPRQVAPQLLSATEESSFWVMTITAEEEKDDEETTEICDRSLEMIVKEIIP